MIICYLPPIKGTRKLHWFPSVSTIPNCCWKQELARGLSRNPNRLDTDSSNPQAWQSLPSAKQPLLPFRRKNIGEQKVHQILTDDWIELPLFFVLLPWHLDATVFFSSASDLQKISASLPAPTSYRSAWLCSILLILPEGNIPPDPGEFMNEFIFWGVEDVWNEVYFPSWGPLPS